MKYLIKSKLTKEEAKAFKGRCVTPQSFAYIEFQEGDVVDGDEYYVKKAVEAGAKAGKVIKAKKAEKTEPESEAETEK